MLEVEKIRWMMNRWDSRWWDEDSWEIYTKLRDEMYATISPLESHQLF
ncbi:hypothetical protein [Metabacillus dongyingensis]|nr:hypothetical protein [Metabacillus dongyingensis]